MFQPFGNTTVLPPAEWHPEPRTRGTFSILSSCLITMSLCIWTSLHLNVPEHGRANRQKYRQMGWMILGLLAPELVVWNAWEQRKKVKSLSSWMQAEGFMVKQAVSQEGQDVEGSEQHPDYNGRMNPWTDVHSWFVVMGGLAFEDTAPKDQRFMPEGRRRIPLTVSNFKWMLEYNRRLIPDISRAAIEDRSKSDQLGKILTCWQAVFFCIQCIYRLSQHLSITLLELNVFAHAICALILILIWWNKPRDIREPTLITGEEAMDACAYRLACLEDLVPIRNYSTGTSPVEHRNVLPEDQSRLAFCAVPGPKQPGECLEISDATTLYARLPNIIDIPPRCLVSENEKDHEFVKVHNSYWEIIWDNLVNPSSIREQGIQVTLNSYNVELLARAYRHMARNPGIMTGLKLYELSHRTRMTDWHLKYWDTWHLLSAPPSQLFQANVLWLLAGLTCAGAFYGGLHLIAWENAFPSHVEAILWRAGGATIISTGPFCALAALYGGTMMLVVERPGSSETLGMLALVFPYAILIFASLLWYIFCRTFLVVECFILLAHIPDSALHMPTWSTYIPHIV